MTVCCGTLALTYQKLKSQHPSYKGDILLEKICETPEFKPYKKNPEQIRQKLSQVREALSDNVEAEIFKSAVRARSASQTNLYF